MVSVSPKLARVKTNFDRVCKSQLDFSNSLPLIHKGREGRFISIGKIQQERLCEMTFIILFTAWEQFLETTFITLIVDAPLATFKRRHRVLVTDFDTAYDLIRGSRKYVEWADPNQVRERAKVFFKGGEPFESALSAVSDDLMKMRIIRNRCVHYSQHATEQYDKMMRQVYGSGKRITPGRVLLTAPTPGLSTVSGASGYASAFELYCEILSTASFQIVPEKSR